MDKLYNSNGVIANNGLILKSHWPPKSEARTAPDRVSLMLLTKVNAKTHGQQYDQQTVSHGNVQQPPKQSKRYNCVLPGYQMLTNFPAINVLNLNLHFRYLYILSCANHLTKPSYGQFKILLWFCSNNATVYVVTSLPYLLDTNYEWVIIIIVIGYCQVIMFKY